MKLVRAFDVAKQQEVRGLQGRLRSAPQKGTEHGQQSEFRASAW